LTQLQPISVIFSLPQQDLQQIMTQIKAGGGQKLPVLAMGQDGKTVVDNGMLELVDNEIDQTTGTIKLKATFPNKDHMLWPGGFSNMRLLVKTESGVLVIPSVAVQRGPQGTYVFVVQPDHTVKIRPITVAMSQDNLSVISDGLQDNEQVATDGMIKLQDGSKVALPGDKQTSGPADQQTSDKKEGGGKGDGEKHHHKHDDSSGDDKDKNSSDKKDSSSGSQGSAQ
jgi:multidrug efflux system membrane fusion protein